MDTVFVFLRIQGGMPNIDGRGNWGTVNIYGRGHF